MNRKIIISFITAGVILFSSCQKSTDIFVPDPGQLNGPDTTWQSIITPAMPVSTLKSSLLIEPYIDSIQVNSNLATITTPFGVQVNFPPNCCVNTAGQPVTGKVEVELLLLKKKGDMIRMARPTISNDRLLVSAGEIFIRLLKAGQPIQLAPNAKINIRYTDFPTNLLMKFFVGDESNTQQFNWLPNPDPANNILNIGTQNYEIYTNHLRWIGCSYLYDTAGAAMVNVSADIANYFTNANTVAFTVFKDFRSVVSMKGDLSVRRFSTPKLPVGKPITVVVISKQAGDYYLGFTNTVTLASTTGGGNQPVQVIPIKKSLPEILAYLSTL